MELLIRGKYVLTSATDPRVLTDAAVRVSGDLVSEVGDWETLRRAHPEARVVGNGTHRLQAMLDDKNNAGAILNSPFSLIAATKGMHSLGRTTDMLGPYQAGGAFVRRDWARQHAEVLEQYLAAFVEALRWSLDPRVGPWLREHARRFVAMEKRARSRPVAESPPRPALAKEVPYLEILRALRGHASPETETFLVLAGHDCEARRAAAPVLQVDAKWRRATGKRAIHLAGVLRRLEPCRDIPLTESRHDRRLLDQSHPLASPGAESLLRRCR